KVGPGSNLLRKDSLRYCSKEKTYSEFFRNIRRSLSSSFVYPKKRLHRLFFQGYTLPLYSLAFASCATTLRTNRNPLSFSKVRIDSGWNCTAARGRLACSIAIITPSSLSAVTRNSAGSL